MRDRQRGTASLELVGLLPLVAVVCLLLLQGAAALFAMQAASDAVRQAARADSLGRDPRTAAEQALPGGLRVDSFTSFGPGHGARLTVRVPRLSPIPQITVTREAVLP